MNWKIVYTKKADEELESIYEYVSNVLGEPMTAKNLVETIMKNIRSLEQMPKRYRAYADEPWHSRGLRVLPVKNYLVFYLPVECEKTVYIVRIMYAGRDIAKQLD